MEERVYQELTMKYEGARDRADSIERREWLREHMRRKYASAAGLMTKEKTAQTVRQS